MAGLRELGRKLESASELDSVVTTMKALAAARIRRFERAVDSLERYMATVRLGLAVALRNRPEGVAISSTPPREAGLGAVVVGSQQGLSGQFNEELAGHAAARINEFGSGAIDRRVLALGGQIVPRLEREGVLVHRTVRLPGSVEGITETVQRTLAALEEWREEGVERFVLLHHRPLGGARFEPRIVHLLPLDLSWLRKLGDEPWESRSLPIHFARWPELFAALVREYLFVALYRGVGESLAAENASRLAAMQAAQKNIEERLDELRGAYNHERQSSITAELLDIVSGFEALTGEQ